MLRAERQAGAEDVHLHGVVDDELCRDERVDRGRVAAQLDHRIAHGGEVDDRGHAREVLQEHARGPEGDLVLWVSGRVPARDGLHLVGRSPAQSLGPHDVLEEDAEGVGQPLEVVVGGERVEARHRVRPSADVEFR